jgi:DNA-binding XRE family transcriptional regulator
MGIERDDFYKRIVDTVIRLRSTYPDGRPRERKITQGDLATMVGVSKTMITNVENRRQLMPFHLFYDVCLALRVEPRDVLPSMRELGQNLEGADQNEIVVGGTNLHSEFEEDVVTIMRDALKKA